MTLRSDFRTIQPQGILSAAVAKQTQAYLGNSGQLSRGCAQRLPQGKRNVN